VIKIHSEKTKKSSGVDTQRGVSYQNCCAIAKILDEWNNPDFRYIIIEDPKNEIEDINCVYRKRIEYLQIKKRDTSLWTKSSMKSVINSFLGIFRNPKEKIRRLYNERDRFPLPSKCE